MIPTGPISMVGTGNWKASFQPRPSITIFQTFGAAALRVWQRIYLLSVTGAALTWCCKNKHAAPLLDPQNTHENASVKAGRAQCFKKTVQADKALQRNARKNVSSGKLAVSHKCNDIPAQLALTLFTGSKLCVQWVFRAKCVADVGNAH